MTQRDLVCNYLIQSNLHVYLVQILHGSRSGLLDLGLREYSIKMKGVDLLLQKGKRICLFWHKKMVSCLWRADPSFMNSVTGSSNVEKCSNIQQDIRLGLGEVKFG